MRPGRSPGWLLFLQASFHGGLSSGWEIGNWEIGKLEIGKLGNWEIEFINYLFRYLSISLKKRMSVVPLAAGKAMHAGFRYFVICRFRDMGWAVGMAWAFVARSTRQGGAGGGESFAGRA
jgi:hypothetical protein